MNLQYLFSKICSLVDLVSGSNHLFELDSELLWILNLPSNLLMKILNILFSNFLMPTQSLLLLLLNTLEPLTTMVLMLVTLLTILISLGLLMTLSTWPSVALKLLQFLRLLDRVEVLVVSSSSIIVEVVEIF